MRRLSLGFALALATVAGVGAVHAQSAELSLEADGIYAGAPFVLDLATEGFAESPQPTVADFALPGCTIDGLGVSPNVSTAISIINGRRSEEHHVTFVFRYRVVCAKAGTYKVPALTASQGGKTAHTRPASFAVTDVDRTDDMQLRLELPARPVSVGETFDLGIDWYLRKDPEEPSFSIPLFDRPADFEVAAAKPTGGDALRFTIAGRDLALPYVRDTATLDGGSYTRFRFTARITPLTAGTIDLGAASVVAKLPIGYGRDNFGFQVARASIFKAEDQARTIEVRPLPASGRPASYANAVGTSFAIEVRASQTVVRVGDPIELDVTIRGDAHLEGLSLPDLGAPGELPAADFDVLGDKPAGEMIEDGKAKHFKVTVRLKRAVGQIPPLELGYYDPAKGAYAVARSQAIALQTSGAVVVGASDVVGGGPGKPGQAEQVTTVVGGDLSLSPPDQTLRTALSMARVRPFLYGLYGVPTLLVGVGVLRRQRRRRNPTGAAQRGAARELEDALAAAQAGPVRDRLPAVLAALRALADAAGVGLKPASELIAELENRAYDPAHGGAPLPAELAARVRELAAGLRPRRGRAGVAAGVVVLGLGLVVAGQALAGEPLDLARTAYQGALAQSEREPRTREFGHAEQLYRQLVADHAGCPELLTDWGNAALGAYDLGHATLGYRRALALAPTLERARQNLGWVRGHLPEWARARDGGGAIDSLFFWHNRLTAPTKHAVAACAFALAMLLFVPLGGNGRERRRRRFAIVPLLVFAAMLGSALLARDLAGDGVVVSDGVVLRGADSSGAPAAIAEPIPAGTEVVVAETRDAWRRVTLPGGQSGWLPASAIDFVVAR